MRPTIVRPPGLVPALVPALASTIALAVPAASSHAQQDRDAAEWLDDCRSGRWGGDRARACAVREVTLRARDRLVVDGGQNGGVTILGEDRDDIRVVARLQADAERGRDAEALLEDVRVETGSEVHAVGPRMRDGESWSVSYTIYVPRRTSLALETRNGGVRVRDVEGTVRFRAVNGGVSLGALAGDVRGETQNGGVQVALAGTRWRGAGLDVRTQNGGVQISVPERYDAELETGTVNGRLDVDFPMTVRGRVDRTIRARLGEGGAPVRVTTTNGAVSVRRR